MLSEEAIIKSFSTKPGVRTKLSRTAAVLQPSRIPYKKSQISV